MTTIELSQFTGTESYHRTFMFTPELVHTDGVQYFADTAGCYWFLDIVATEIYPLLRQHPFLSIKFVCGGGQGAISIEDGDCNILKVRRIDHTDCPEGEYEFFLTDNVLMLTSEY
jgi:hypothetical protein